MPLKVALIMGSVSDKETMQKAADALKELGVPYEAHVMSAHRTPQAAADFAAKAKQEGFGVIVAMAGMAAHLAGVLAGHTTLPVVGVPCGGGVAGGLDALLATVQMPSGVPVATVALNGGRNAAILAAQMLALQDDALAGRLASMKKEMEASILEADKNLEM